MTPAATKAGQPPTVAERSAFLLALLGRVAARRLKDELAETGLKSPHATILIMLRDVGPLSQQDLGERLHVDPSNLVGFLNSLEEDGLVVRRRDPADRRRHIVEVTKQGIDRCPACQAPIDAIEDQLFAGLSGEDRERLHSLLADVVMTMSVEEVPPGDRSDLD